LISGHHGGGLAWLKEKYAQTTANNERMFKWLAIIVLCILVVGIYFYWAKQFGKESGECKTMNKHYADLPPISSVTVGDPLYENPLSWYYIKSSYNSCCVGQFENDYVSTCALVNVIKQGCRVLDFQIFNLDSQPVVAASASTSNFEKGTYNYLSFEDTMNLVSTNAFAITTCNNYNDPLILSFRVMSTDVSVYNAMADVLKDAFGNPDDNNGHMLDSRYSNEHVEYADDPTIKSICDVPLTDLLGKVIIAVTCVGPKTYKSTDLEELVNIAGNEPYLWIMTEHKLIYNEDPDALTEHNRSQMCICLPNLSSQPDNYAPTAPMLYGTQMCMMCYQRDDTSLQVYNELFDTQKHAFIMKPKSLLPADDIPVEQAEDPPLESTFGYTTNTGAVNSYTGEPLYSFKV